jgi:hypothetical protein
MMPQKDELKINENQDNKEKKKDENAPAYLHFIH